MLNLLQQSGQPYLHEFVEIAGRDGKKLDPLENRIRLIEGLLQNSSVESQPGFMPIKVKARVSQNHSLHKQYPSCAKW
jgi:hypothetical protein